ncbi:MAG: CPBP family intramembrane glutamic endopeptidase [Limisphaerales bacterium]
MLSHRPWSVDNVLRLLIWLFVGLAVVGLCGELVRRATEGWAEPLRKTVVSSTSTLLMHAVVIGLVAWFVRLHGLAWREAFGFGRPRQWQAIGLGILAIPLILPVTLGLQAASELVLLWRTQEVVLQPAVRLVSATREPWMLGLLAVQTIVTAPIAEELLFRGVLHVAVKQAGYPHVALWGVAILFGLSHGNFLTFAPLVFFGLALAWLYERTDNLLTPVLTHMLFNALNFAWLVLVESGG